MSSRSPAISSSHPGTEALHHARRELLHQEPPQAGVDRRIGRRDDRRGVVSAERRVCPRAEEPLRPQQLELVPRAREIVDAPEHVRDVRVAGDDPRPPGLAPVHRILLADRAIHGVGVLDEVGRAQELIEPGDIRCRSRGVTGVRPRRRPRARGRARRRIAGTRRSRAGRISHGWRGRAARRTGPGHEQQIEHARGRSVKAPARRARAARTRRVPGATDGEHASSDDVSLRPPGRGHGGDAASLRAGCQVGWHDPGRGLTGSRPRASVGPVTSTWHESRSEASAHRALDRSTCGAP